MVTEAAPPPPLDSGADALFGEAVRLARAGNDEGARRAFRRVAALWPGHPLAAANLGVLLRKAGRLEEAAVAFRRALTLSAEQPKTWSDHASLTAARGRPAEAVALYRRSIALEPSAAAYYNYGNALRELQRPDEVLTAYRRAIALQPDFALAHVNAAVALKDAGRGNEVLERLRKALCLDPAGMTALYNTANQLRDTQNATHSVTFYRRAAAVAPAMPQVRWDLALNLLRIGELREGFDEYEWGWRLPRGGRGSLRRFQQPVWAGEELAGRTILVWAEQGLGDSLQFLRYAPLLAERGGTVVLEVQREIAALARRLPGIDRVVPRGEPGPPFDVHIPLLSLPRFLPATLDTLPGRTPYLMADPARVAAWAERLSVAGGALRVGLVWAGNPDFVADRLRSPGFSAVRPILDVPGVHVFILQKGAGLRELEGVRLPEHVTNLAPEIADFDDTASIMAGLDVVVSSCTGPTHMAGALGRPTWVLLHALADWRWLVEGDGTPWYPTARLFRQPALGDWGTPVARLAAALERWAAERGRSA